MIHMKDRQYIRIRDPKLQRVRLNLRSVLSLVCKSESERIHEELENLRFNKKWERVTIDKMTESQVKRYREIQAYQNDLRERLRISIVLCDRCGTIDGDRYYNKTFRSWFCPKCVDEIRREHLKMMEKRKAGTYTCPDDDGEFGQSFM